MNLSAHPFLMPEVQKFRAKIRSVRNNQEDHINNQSGLCKPSLVDQHLDVEAAPLTQILNPRVLICWSSSREFLRMVQLAVSQRQSLLVMPVHQHGGEGGGVGSDCSPARSSFLKSLSGPGVTGSEVITGTEVVTGTEVGFRPAELQHRRLLIGHHGEISPGGELGHILLEVLVIGAVRPAGGLGGSGCRVPVMYWTSCWDRKLTSRSSVSTLLYSCSPCSRSASVARRAASLWLSSREETCLHGFFTSSSREESFPSGFLAD
ncbi:hypothetical protein F7725_016332 [Dissostichus mawsoni]|uniref:Uncharacterized protein n=1 Tax=Dissostichus mawsoni TaxID=36200 RepID=A0A7J5Z3G4_DISMA|nr:hypothetical protein F7725_016332 [Dissostichus mawsoni]